MGPQAQREAHPLFASRSAHSRGSVRSRSAVEPVLTDIPLRPAHRCLVYPLDSFGRAQRVPRGVLRPPVFPLAGRPHDPRRPQSAARSHQCEVSVESASTTVLSTLFVPPRVRPRSNSNASIQGTRTSQVIPWTPRPSAPEQSPANWHDDWPLSRCALQSQTQTRHESDQPQRQGRMTHAQQRRSVTPDLLSSTLWVDSVHHGPHPSLGVVT